MSKMSNYLENLLIDRVLRNQSFTPVANVYLGLFTGITAGGDGDPTAQTEVSTSGTAYARQAVTFNAPSAGACTNSNAISFTDASSNWGTTTHWGLFDASTAGNLLYWGDHADISVNTGENFSVAAGQMSVSLGGGISQAFAHSLLNASLRNTALSAITANVALLTAFTNDSTFTEVSDGGYARLTSTWNAASNGLIDNSADILFGAASGGGYTVSHAAIFDASSGGNLFWRGALSASKAIATGKQFKFPAGSLDLSLA